MSLVSDGCLYHVSLAVDTAVILAANDEKQMQLLSKCVGIKERKAFEKACDAEMQEGLKVDAARKTVEDLVKIALRCLLSAQKLSIAEDDELEIRVLLCRKEAVTA